MTVPANNVKKALLEEFSELPKEKIEQFFKNKFLVATEKDKIQKNIDEYLVKIRDTVASINFYKDYYLSLLNSKFENAKANFITEDNTLRFLYDYTSSIKLEAAKSKIDFKVLPKDMQKQWLDVKLFEAKYNYLAAQKHYKQMRKDLKEYNNLVKYWRSRLGSTC